MPGAPSLEQPLAPPSKSAKDEAKGRPRDAAEVRTAKNYPRGKP
jgi:hypothetical protein